MFQIKDAERIKTHILCSINVFWKSYCLWDNVEKYGTARHVADDNKILHRKESICMSSNKGYSHMLFMSNIYCFPRPQGLHERASVLPYTCIACLVRAKFHSFFTHSLHDSVHYFFRNSKQSKDCWWMQNMRQTKIYLYSSSSFFSFLDLHVLL